MKTSCSCLSLAGLCLALVGCAPWQTAQPVHPTSYQVSREHIPRTVGKLRRIALIGIHQSAPKACEGNGEVTLLHQGLDAEAATYLGDIKGYEVILPNHAGGLEWAPPGQEQALLEEIAAWSKNTRDDATLGPLTLALLDRAGHDARVDGLVLLHVELTCARANQPFRVFLGVASLGVSEVLPDPKLAVTYPVYRAAILETSGHRCVWRNMPSPAWKGTRDYFKQGAIKPAVHELFDELEPAIPKLLTR